MLEKYMNLLKEAKSNFNEADRDGDIESCEYFDGQINAYKKIIEDLEKVKDENTILH